MVTKDLGMVTAYAYAVAGGYTGTEAQFEQLMADLAIVVDDFDNFSVTVTTLPAGSSATASYSDGVLSLGIPKGDKGDKGNTGNTGATPNLSVGTVETTAEPMVTITGTAENPVLNFGLVKGDKGDTGEVSEAELTETLEDYAKKDGTVANAEQLISTASIEDSVPYKFRTSGGSVDIGNRETDMIVGGTIAWNQKVENGNFASASGWSLYNANASSMSISDNVCTQTIASIPTSTFMWMVQGPINNHYVVVGHKYFVGVDVLAPRAMSFLVSTNGNESVSTRQTVANTWTSISRITAPTREQGYFGVYPWSASEVEVGDVYKYRNAQIFDLTQMFGSTIADYITSLENANRGAGVSFFRSLFPKPYYEYNAGELLSVSGLQSHDMVGFNAWDEEWELGGLDGNTGEPFNQPTTIRSKNFTEVIPNTSYYYYCGSADNYFRICYYDADKSFISSLAYTATNSAYVTPNGCHYIKIAMRDTYGTTYKNDICINLSWDGERDGEYEPYTINSYALDDSLTLRGIPKLDASNNLYYDGDTYESDGTVTRKFNVVTYDGSADEGWRLYGGYRFQPSNADLADFTAPANNVYANIFASNGFKVYTRSALPNDASGAYSVSAGDTGGHRFLINVGTTELSEVTAYLSAHPLTIVYQKNTPTTEYAEPYTNPQIVDDFGTEEYVTDSIVPVGHVTQYMNNLRAKLEMAPESPSGDGDYIVRQTSGENSYVALASTTTIQGIIARLEALENA